MICFTAGKPLLPVFLCLLSVTAAAQTLYSGKLSDWKARFPKEDVVAVSLKQTVDFELNPNPAPGEGKVKAVVTTEQVLVPLKDFYKYEDALFYYDEMAVEGVKVVNEGTKNVPFEKQCQSYRDEDIFHSDTKYCLIKFQFAEKGKPVTFTYQNRYRDIKYLTSFYLRHHLPTVDRTIQFNVPSWLEMDFREFNFTGKGVHRSSVSEGGITRITFRQQEVPAYQREPSSPNHALSDAHVICVSKAFSDGGQRHTLFENVKDVYGWYHSLVTAIGNQPEALKSRVSELTFGKKTDLEKIEAIFYWVQDNIRYIAFEDGIMGFKPDAAQNVLKNKYGDCKGKANLLKEMLKLAGYDARLTWIGTSDLPYDYTLPSLAVDNHMICTVQLGGKRYFLDGTEDYIALNDYAQRIQGKQVMIEDGAQYILDRIPEFPAERNWEKKTVKLRLDETTLKGSATIEYNGEAKINLQRLFASVRTDKKADAVTGYLKGSENVTVTGLKNSDINDRQKPLQLSYELSAANQVTKTGNELYVIMDWDKEFGSFEIPSDRQNDYEFSQKYHFTVQTELAVPAGYKVDYLPAPVKKVTPDYAFEGAYVQSGTTIIYKKTITIRKPILRHADFASWNAFIAEINKFYNDQVVLTK
ncbi:MAG TPA: transglutaminase domain-containing protein [Chitinophagaceae bacterium]|jgi:transglutaminase-like putative cysteine protease|nr:transglutaminase domain-containing protein [Chitinophagaceae bacterium]